MITSGSVTVEDGLKKAEEYAPPRKVSVTINFSTPEGQDAEPFLEKAKALANGSVAELLGGKATAAVAPKAAAKKAEKPKEEPKPAEAPKERTKADLEADMMAELNAPKTAPTVPVDPDDLSDLLGDAAPQPVTDKELSDAIIAKANKMKTVSGWDAKKLRELVEKFVGAAGAKFAQIPAAKRHDFLKELDGLK